MPTRHAKQGGVGGSLGAAIRNERFDKVGYKMARNLGDKDCPKNAHLVCDWEDLDEEAKTKMIAINTSVTDQDDLGALLSMANLADRDFTAERANARVVEQGAKAIQQSSKGELPEELKKLPIPIRPEWSKAMTAERVDKNEREAFLEWRRNLAQVEEKYNAYMTPFEKNIEFWRQLWRVVEKSDVVVQVVDARNPLLYRCEALEEYVKQVGAWKGNVILFNKADLLPFHVRASWGRYLDSLGIKYFFFAARSEIEKNLKTEKDAMIEEGDEGDEEGWEARTKREMEALAAREAEEERMRNETCEMATGRAAEGRDAEEDINAEHTCRVLNAEQLLNVLEFLGRECVKASGRPLPEEYANGDNDAASVASGISRASSRLQREYIMIGFVGYPNVGKSSTINALVGRKKVGVTSTPGKTKHFQTLIVSDSVMLCDCPGLVFPSVVSSRAEMVCGGILPLNALRDHIGPMELMAQRIPRAVFEETYNINLPSRMPNGMERVYISWMEICSGYAVSRGMITAGAGVPDTHTAAIKLLRDYVGGKLRFCHTPPGKANIALGPVNPEDCMTPEQEAAAKASEAAAAKAKAQEEQQTSGVAIGDVKKNRRSRANRGLSAGVFAEDLEGGLFREGKQVMVATAGKKGKNKGVMDFRRVERPYNLEPARH
mmetsp:Transcript_45697/g.111258  ORF Transcript_45697/g.111258 Transcript_45697/m.111258 type:complete len:662 (-) Transcript_45697:156-2141(-)